MASLSFPEIIEEIKKERRKIDENEDIYEEIINKLSRFYGSNPRLFINIIKLGGFNIANLNIYEPLSVIITEFLSGCEGLSLDELSNIFSKLYEQNKGFTLLKEIRDKLLEKNEDSPEPDPPEPPDPPIARKILFLSANPKGTPPLRLGKEMREIEEILRRSNEREQFVIETRQAVRYTDIQTAFLDFDPNIVHFSGHGAGEEGLVFEDETGQERLVETEVLASLFELFADKIEFVFLNACYSEVQAKAIVEHIPFVVGMKKAISDRAAIEFAKGFYAALGAGRTVEFAYKSGCTSIKIERIPEDLIPQLLKKNYLQKRSLSPISPPIYKNLEEYLANKQWKEADLETMRLMIKIANSIGNSMKDRKIITWLDQEDLKKIPDEDLKIIDKLWINYSDGHFGFSVQAKIWDECWGQQKPFELTIYREKFATRVGWSDGINWIEKYDNLTFSRNAEPGHLPSLSFPKKNTNEISWKSWKETFKCLFPRLFKLMD
ncbi:MAG: CHAT domain-containing protein [Okeania sp. SIO3C4]|nr:CHAT domain-containing protein [Okeania sp. SIO3C4]